jgi:hypothetical protein
MSKRSPTTLTFGPNTIAHQLVDGNIVIADPDAPIEYDCRVLLVLSHLGQMMGTGAAVE